MESGIKQIVPGVSIPWASRDGESPDVIYWKNMILRTWFLVVSILSLLLSTVLELVTRLSLRMTSQVPGRG